MNDMNGETKAEEVKQTERGGSKTRAQRILVVAGVAAFAVVAVAARSWFERMTATGGAVTLRQTSIVPGRFPLVVRTYELSNGCARSLAFYRPNPRFPLFYFQTFAANEREPQGCWESQPGGVFTVRTPRPTWIPPGGTASFSLELPDDRHPRRLLVPLFENAFFSKRCAVVAVSGENASFQPDNNVGWFGVPPASVPPAPVLVANDDGTISLDGRPGTFAEIRERLQAQIRRMGIGMAVVDADDNAKLKQLADLHNLCNEEGFYPAIATDSGTITLPNTMSDEWRLGDFENPEIENADDLSKNGPFAPAVVRLDGADIYVNGVLCPETNLVERLAEASDDGARALGFHWKGDEPCRPFKRVLAAYHDIGGAWPFLYW